MPALLRQAGVPLDKAIVSTALLNLGGIVGALMFARLIDRLGPYRVLVAAYLAAGAATLAIGRMTQAEFPALMAMVFVAGFCVIGAQISINALASGLYATEIRSTGVGWALGVGRAGSIVGPVVGGVLVGTGVALEFALHRGRASRMDRRCRGRRCSRVERSPARGTGSGAAARPVTGSARMTAYVLPPPPTIAVPVAGNGALFPVRRVYCVGRNYAAHAREMGFSDREPPFFFCKPADAIVAVREGTTAEIAVPRPDRGLPARDRTGRRDRQARQRHPCRRARSITSSATRSAST